MVSIPGLLPGRRFLYKCNSSFSTWCFGLIWALINLVTGYLLFTAAKMDGRRLPLLVFFAGIAFMSIYVSKHFQKKYKE